MDPDGRKDDDWVKHIPSNCQSFAKDFIKVDTPNWYSQQTWSKDGFEAVFWKSACFATSLLNIVSTVYQKETGAYLSETDATNALTYAIKQGFIDKNDAYVSDIAGAVNAMGASLGLEGKFSVNEKNPQYAVFALANKTDPKKSRHFVNARNDYSGFDFFDVWGAVNKSLLTPIGYQEDSTTGNKIPVYDRLQEGRPIRGLDYKLEE